MRAAQRRNAALLTLDTQHGGRVDDVALENGLVHFTRLLVELEDLGKGAIWLERLEALNGARAASKHKQARAHTHT